VSQIRVTREEFLTSASACMERAREAGADLVVLGEDGEERMRIGGFSDIRPIAHCPKCGHEFRVDDF
jgi:hypothetical protein